MVALAEGAHRSRSAAATPSMTVARAQAAARDLETWMLSSQALALPVHRLEVEQERRVREVQRCRGDSGSEAGGEEPD